MRKRLISIIAVAALLFSFMPLAQAGFTMVPSKPDTRRQFNFQINPGESISDSVIIENINATPLTLLLYGADATHSNQGSFALVNRTATQRTVGNWVKFDSSTVSLNPGERKVIPFTITLPDKITPGSYAGGIAAETTTVQPTQQNAQNGSTGAGVIISSRLVVKLFITVPGEKTVKYSWAELTHTLNANNKYHFSFTYNNEGNAAIMVDPKIEISGFPSNYNGEYKIPGTTLLQGEKVSIPYDWNQNPFFGTFTVKATTTFWEYDIATNQNINPQTETRTFVFYVIPWKIVGVILGVIVLLIAFFVFRKFRKVHLKKKCSLYTVRESDTLVSLSKETGVSWKGLAKINKLKPPYNLSKGDIIHLPPFKTKK